MAAAAATTTTTEIAAMAREHYKESFVALGLSFELAFFSFYVVVGSVLNRIPFEYSIGQFQNFLDIIRSFVLFFHSLEFSQLV